MRSRSTICHTNVTEYNFGGGGGGGITGGVTDGGGEMGIESAGVDSHER